MHRKEFHYRWEHEFQSSPEELWTLVADTNRFNHDAGLPAVTPRHNDDSAPLRNARRRLRLRWHGVETAWEEEPFEWLRPHRFSVVRRYAGGPVAEVRVQADLTPRDGGGTHLVYQVSARPKNALGSVLIPLQIGRRMAKKFSALLRRYDRLARGAGEESAADTTGARGSTIKRDRLPAVERALGEQGASPELYERLLQTVEAEDDLTVARLRPYALADRWRAPRREVLTLCLLATRAGLLDLRWDVLCPLCRGAEQNGFDFVRIEMVFEGETVTILDDRFDYGEERFVTFGLLEGHVVAIAHTETDEVIRIISVRKATKNEESSYFKEISD